MNVLCDTVQLTNVFREHRIHYMFDHSDTFNTPLESMSCTVTLVSLRKTDYDCTSH